MDIKESVLGRRSVRSYLEKEVSLEDIADILEVARFSPSAANTQNWKVIVVTDSKLRTEIASICRSKEWMAEAPVHLVICNEYSKLSKMFEPLGKMFSIQDCAILATNIVNLAHAAELGTCWVGSFPPESIKKLLALPEDGVDPEIILTLGYSAEKPKVTKRKDISDFCYFDKWDKKDAKFKPKSPLDKIREKFLDKIKK